MVRVLRYWAALLAWLRSSQARREAEILYLRQQLIVLKRSVPVRPRLKATDRLIFVCLYRLFPSLIDASIVFQPETLLRWHRRGFRLFWRWKSRRAARSPCPVGRHPKSRSTNQSREPSLGRAAYPWRVAQARHRDRPIFRCQVHGAATRAAVTGLEDLPPQSRARRRCYRSVRCKDHRLQAALWLGDHPS
jgi:hypothetical protein